MSPSFPLTSLPLTTDLHSVLLGHVQTSIRLCYFVLLSSYEALVDLFVKQCSAMEISLARDSKVKKCFQDTWWNYWSGH